MNCHNAEARPLLRGTIIGLTGWTDADDQPGMQRQFGQIAVWCPFCATLHYHSWDLRDDGAKATHRVAHCQSEKSPFLKSGYFISTIRKSEPGYTAHVATPGKDIVRQKPEKKEVFT